MRKFLLGIFLIHLISNITCLYPFETASRTKLSLNGIWDFKVDFNNEGLKDNWQNKVFKTELDDVLRIAVPSSYNDLYSNQSIRYHVGWTWYNKEFHINTAIKKSINDHTIMLRISSCHYFCYVWLNGIQLGQHESGHLPFEFDISSIAASNDSFNLVIAVNNTLSDKTIPPAGLFYGNDPNLFPDNYVEQTMQMDFFNYAGLHRDVLLYIKPIYSIQDVILKTDYYPDLFQGSVKYKIVTNCKNSGVNVSIIDKKGVLVAFSQNMEDTLIIKNPQLWWPRFIKKANGTYGYLYRFKTELSCNQNMNRLNLKRRNISNISSTNTYFDIYSFDFGVRSISWSTTEDNNQAWKINSEPFYCMGVDRHEDFPVLGRGVDQATLIKDLYLFDWLNVNCIRTSHYPYAEEFYQLTDKFGIVVLDEVPAVGLTLKENFNNVTLNLHKQLLQELYNRDKNHPSVIVWSIANEPSSDLPESLPYFTEVFQFMRSIDNSRPLTFTVSKTIGADRCANLSDIICINRYYGWYTRTGHLEIIAYQLANDLQKWDEKYKKPMIISEYGADALPGIHCYPEQIFCEEFQEALFEEHHKVFDNYRNKSILYGELVWNFQDFMTDQDLKRAYGNHKGLFTREREPKPTAFIVKKRYETIKNEA